MPVLTAHIPCTSADEIGLFISSFMTSAREELILSYIQCRVQTISYVKSYMYLECHRKCKKQQQAWFTHNSIPTWKYKVLKKKVGHNNTI